MISEGEFRGTIVEMVRRSAIALPADVVDAIKRGAARERRRVARLQFECMLKNLELAGELRAPICQDTGTFTFFIGLGLGLRLGFDPRRAIERAVEEAEDMVPLRPNAVDPLTRASIHAHQPDVRLELVEGERLRVDLLVKGAGAENCSRLYMLNPADGGRGIERAVLSAISEAGGRPCPPTIVGVGIGGSADLACMLAKKALLRPLDEPSPDPELRRLELRLAEAANELGIGPMGLGGRTTVLGVRIEKAACHTASLPVAVSFQCWAARRAKVELINGKLQVEVP